MTDWTEPGPLPRDTDPGMIRLHQVMDRILLPIRMERARRAEAAALHLTDDLEWDTWRGDGPDVMVSYPDHEAHADGQ